MSATTGTIRPGTVPNIVRWHELDIPLPLNPARSVRSYELTGNNRPAWVMISPSVRAAYTASLRGIKYLRAL